MTDNPATTDEDNSRLLWLTIGVWFIVGQLCVIAAMVGVVASK